MSNDPSMNSVVATITRKQVVYKQWETKYLLTRSLLVTWLTLLVVPVPSTFDVVFPAFDLVAVGFTSVFIVPRGSSCDWW